MRDTKTKGIWVWGAPVELDINGVKTSVIYLDTEGFESVGKSNVYDDRKIGSLILPQIRKADISQLSFAVELAEEYYGKSVKEMVDEALRLVPNVDGDKNINQVNQIRELAIMGDNSTACSIFLACFHGGGSQEEEEERSVSGKKEQELPPELNNPKEESPASGSAAAGDEDELKEQEFPPESNNPKEESPASGNSAEMRTS
ncbi:hypothetical protein MLD38_027997 [Melastoma candidum]|uniref:Uncharacterized protein n=1 Tax=Melastoma candidum TaxID=119954 RepID=A0ACB9N5R0_9MYRT|nr:hypothetical protein MLD38_027997 [Melastoma candidum]